MCNTVQILLCLLLSVPCFHVHAERGPDITDLVIRRRIIIPKWIRNNPRDAIGFNFGGNPKNLGPLAKAMIDQMRAGDPILLNSRRVFINDGESLAKSLEKFPNPSLYPFSYTPQTRAGSLSVWNAIPNSYPLFTPPTTRILQKYRQIDPHRLQIQPTSGQKAMLRHVVRNIPFINRTVRRKTSTKWPFVVGTFESPQKFIRIPFQKDFLVHDGESGKQSTQNTPVPLKPPFLSMKQDFNFLRSNTNSIYFDAGRNVPLDNGIVFENSFNKLGPLLPGEKERVYYDGKIYKKMRHNRNEELNKRDLGFLQQDFQRFLSSPPRLQRLGRLRNGPASILPKSDMSRSILYIAFFAACCAIIHATPLNGIPELPSLNFDFPPPVPNAPDLQTAGAYPTNSPIRPDGKLSGALANQNIFMEPLGGVEFGKSFGGFGKQAERTGINSGFNQNTGTDFGSPSLGQLGMKSGFGTPSGSFGEVPNAGIGQMDINSGIGNPSGLLGKVPNAGVGQPGVDLGLTSGQRSASTSGQVRPQTNTYRSGTPQVPGIRGGVRNIMPIFTPPPVILLPPRRPFSFLFGRRPRLVTIPLIPLGAPVPISMARRPF